MNRTMTILALLVFPVLAAADSLEDARTAATWYLSSLKASMAQALREKGTAAALESCNHGATQVTKDLLAASRLTLRLTSLQTRNPANEPTPAEREILKKLQEAQRGGKLPRELVEKMQIQGKTRVVYVKPVLVDEQCLPCHGKIIMRGISDILRRKYPEDTATGYRLGDLRGMISITLPEK